MTPESMKTMQNDMALEFDPRRVANFLKQELTQIVKRVLNGLLM